MSHMTTKVLKSCYKYQVKAFEESLKKLFLDFVWKGGESELELQNQFFSQTIIESLTNDKNWVHNCFWNIWIWQIGHTIDKNRSKMAKTLML